MRKELTLFTFLTLLLITMVTVHCTKQDDPSTQPTSPVKSGAVKGKVSNEYNQLLSGAVLSIQGNGTDSSVTATDGNYMFRSLQPGSYHLSIKRGGYIETSATISILPGDTLTKDFVLKAGTAYLNVVPDSVITVNPYAGTFTIKVASNTSWSINNANSWITPDKLNGNGDDSIVVNFAASPEDTVRQGNVVVQAGSMVKNILVKQLPDVKLKQTIALPGNLALGISDSIALVFNQPVTIKSMFPGYTYCQSDIKFSYAGNKVTFSYACAALGGDYPFTITTNNSLGDQYTFTFSAGFYEKIINLTGTIQSSFVNDADNSYWVITDHPNALYKIDMTTFNILHKYDLPNEPAMFTVSPYNNKIYLAYRRIPKLYILNQDGTTDQVMDIPHDTSRGIYETNGPIIYPVQIAFTKTGKGMIWLNDQYSNGYPYFWFIDAAAGHRIWYQSVPGYSGGLFLNPKVNHDQTKLVLNSVNGDPTIGIFDLQQMTLSSYRPSRYDIGGFVTPSRKNANLYVGQLYFQLIANPATGFESMTVNKDNRNGGNVDFCYKPGRDLTVYFTEGGYMQVIDYATGKTFVKHDALYYLKGTTATLDGKYIIVNRHDGNYNAKVIQLPASWFDY
jgi:hypothetical protein